MLCDYKSVVLTVLSCFTFLQITPNTQSVQFVYHAVCVFLFLVAVGAESFIKICALLRRTVKISTYFVCMYVCKTVWCVHTRARLCVSVLERWTLYHSAHARTRARERERERERERMVGMDEDKTRCGITHTHTRCNSFFLYFSFVFYTNKRKTCISTANNTITLTS